MLTEIFKAVLIMSVVGGTLTLALLVLKPLTKRIFGHKWQFYIWLSVIIVLMLPVKFEETNFFPAGTYSEIQMSVIIPEQTARMIEETGFKAGKDFNGTAINWFYIIAAIWASVAAVLLIKTVIDSILLKSRLYGNSAYIDNLKKAEIRECSLVGTPILFGGIRPVLYIPEKLKDSEKLRYIVAHEGVHLRRGDIAVKWFSTLAKCIHWFNPLVYAIVKQIDEACEISCDLEATRKMSAEEKTEYMQTVLEISQNDIDFKSALMAGLTGGGRVLKKRFAAIRKSAKISRIVYCCGIIVAVLITFFSVCFCGIIRGNAKESPEPKSTVVLIENNKEIINERTAFESKETNQPETKIFEDQQKGEEEPKESLKTQAPEKAVIRGKFNSEDGDARQILGISPDEYGRISINIRSNAQETVDIYIIDAESKKEVFSMGIPVPYEATRSFDGLDMQKKYNIILKGPMRNNWEIESEYMIY